MIAADGALQFILGLVCPALTRSTHTQPQSSSARPARVCSTPHLCPPIPHEHLVFIAEITARAFIIADSNKRRTLSRSDIAKALGKSDQFDFLIDIVPRDEIPFPGVVASANGPPGKKPGPTPVATKRDTVRTRCYRVSCSQLIYLTVGFDIRGGQQPNQPDSVGCPKRE